ncbi:hypothetical protein ACSDR0_33340 [Streptosporangium sp. G11]|uniref:hypothetical protein n=1 Tax=Streptosporangium sp. G11 TaxID=3436926 RepID=UPI003EC06ABB
MSKQALPIAELAGLAGTGTGSGGRTCCAPLVCEPLGAVKAEELAPLSKAVADPVRQLSLLAEPAPATGRT